MKLAAKWRVSWTMGDCRLDGYRMESVCVGGDWVDVVRLGRGDPLVLVPGLAGSWKLLLPLVQVLSRHFDVIVPGLRGDGSVWSDLENPTHHVLSVSDYAEDLACVLDHLRLESPTVFGVSFGGAVALELAAEHPHRVGTLVLSGIEARFHRTIGSAIARRALERFPLPSDSPFINQFFHLLYGTKPEPGPLVDFIVKRIWETNQSVMAQRLAQIESFDIAERLWQIDAPTLILAGERDVIVPVARQQRLSEGIVGSQFKVIPEAGHVAFLTHRTSVARAIRRHVLSAKASV